MIRLAYIKNGSASGVRFYRGLGALIWLEKETGHQLRIDVLSTEKGPIEEDAFYGYDLVFVEHAVNEPALRTILNARNCMKRVWIDHDDDLLHVPPYNPAAEYYANPGNQKFITEALRLADLVTVTTPALHSLYKPYRNGTPIHIIPNAWMDYDYGLRKLEPVRKPIQIGWRGAATHDKDIDSVSAPLNLLLKDPAFTFRVWGRFPWMLEGMNRDNFTPWSSMRTFFASFLRNPPDFLFVPLIDNPFNRGKSPITVIEGALAGAPVIAPASLPEFNIPGVIRYRDNSHLREIFAHIKSGKIDKIEQVEQTREAIQPLRLSTLNRKRIDLITELLGIKAAEVPVDAGEGG